jgi:hypothetical protein
MPWLFSYGSLQKEEVQLATFGRRFDGAHDELPGFEPARVVIDDPKIAKRIGRDHHANARFTGSARSHVPGMAFDVTDAELARCDGYEREFAYVRVAATLRSGKRAWVYVHADGAPEAS